jgi:hypothetical protein
MSNETTHVEERVASLFQPDTLMPAQYLEHYRRKSHLEPETRLMLAVLEDGVACYQKYVLARDEKGRQMFRDAEEWVLREDSDWLFSFDNICEAMGLNPQYLRKGMVLWKQAQLDAQPKAKVYHLAGRKAREIEASAPAETGQKLLKASGD